ncbi:FMN-binding protein [bacterium]|nr:FMN-binding protein [bacterium]
MKTILHYGLVLLIIAGVAGVGLSLVDRITKGPIAEAQSKRLEEGQKLAFPSASSFGELKKLETDGKTIEYYEVFDEGKNVIGYELLYSVGGYQSRIKVLTGIEPDGKVVAIRVLEQAETPGLGAEVDALPSNQSLLCAFVSLFSPEPEKEESNIPWFQAQFSGKTPEDLIVVKTKDPKHITALSGATITSTAVTKAVKEPIELFLKAKAEGQL